LNQTVPPNTGQSPEPQPDDPNHIKPDDSDHIKKNLSSFILEPLLGEMLKDPNEPRDVLLVLNEQYKGGVEGVRKKLPALLKKSGIDPKRIRIQQALPYAFGKLNPFEIKALADLDRQSRLDAKDRYTHHLIHAISKDHEVERCITKSIVTVKADAAQRAFSAFGNGIIWAVVDSGVDKDHLHFSDFGNLDIPAPLKHRDFTVTPEQPHFDPCGHGTHVAGIIAGVNSRANLFQVHEYLDADGKTTKQTLVPLGPISGIAPQTKILSLKALDEKGSGKTSAIIEALQYIQEMNQNGRRIVVHGVNLSLGYDFDPKWYACGESPLCVEVNRLVKSGVVVVVAAGNGGYREWLDRSSRAVATNVVCAINDPGNSDLAITTGATHRDMPHTYGVSYFSSRGPTGDGRSKPDLVAPGERIISCLSSAKKNTMGSDVTTADYFEDSGTSMAAPHVSGAIAAFLSVRREFIGRPEVVKEIFLGSAMDLKRDRYFQGSGLLDLMRALQTI
jgi:subtilisin family serine protease